MEKENIYVLPAHYPRLKTKKQVDKWIYIIKKSFKDFFEEK
jgi:hypothetical protein